MEENRIQYISGFNSGYIMAKYHPELFEKLSEGTTLSNSFLEGFKAGKKEYDLELNSKELSEIGRLREKSKTIEREKGQNRDR